MLLAACGSETRSRGLEVRAEGSSVVVSAPRGAEVTVHRNDTTLVASCPGHPRCRDDGDRVVLELPVTVPGEYRAHLVDRGKVVESSQPIWISASTP